MRTLIHSIIILIVQGLISNCSAPGSSGGFQLPDEWTPDFTIDLYTGGGMQERSTTITYTFDSCKYIDRNGTVATTHAFALTAADRKDILKKMHDLKADQLKSVKDNSATQDKESTSLCFQFKTEFCLEDGAATSIQKEDLSNFSDACRYLTLFAVKQN